MLAANAESRVGFFLIDVDDPSLKQIGTFYLGREDEAPLVRNLAGARVAAQAHDVIFAAPTDRRDSATRQGWSKRNGGCDDSMKLRSSSSGCEIRPARGEPARAGSEPGDGRGDAIGEA